MKYQEFLRRNGLKDTLDNFRLYVAEYQKVKDFMKESKNETVRNR